MARKVRILVPGPLRSYTGGRSEVTLDGCGPLLSDVLAALDANHPGIRFRMIDEAGRIREHIRLFVESELACDLHTKVEGEVQIICAISGGVQPLPARPRLDGQNAVQDFRIRPIDWL